MMQKWMWLVMVLMLGAVCAAASHDPAAAHVAGAVRGDRRSLGSFSQKNCCKPKAASG